MSIMEVMSKYDTEYFPDSIVIYYKSLTLSEDTS